MLIVNFLACSHCFFRSVCRENDVPAPASGNRALSDDGLIVTYSCDVGFTLKGNVKRTCQNDSTGWNGSSPSCGTLTF